MGRPAGIIVQVGDKLWRGDKKTPLRVAQITAYGQTGSNERQVLVRAINASAFREWRKQGKYQAAANGPPPGGESYAIDDLVRVQGGWLVRRVQYNIFAQEGR